MTLDVLCLRPRADFIRIGVEPPPELRVDYREPTDPALHELLRSTAVLLIPAVGAKLAPTLLEGSGLKLIQVTGSGVDRIDRDTAMRLGIPVCNVPGGSNGAVAEYAVTAAALLLRRFAWSDAEIRSGHYAAARARLIAENVGGLDGLTVGVVGFGTIGAAVAEAFAHAGCKLVYYDPALQRSATAERLGALPMPLDALLTAADVVSLHVPLLDTTRALIGARELGLMKGGSILIQAARGGVVDESALADALRTGHLGGAAVDVYSSEPPTPQNPLFTLGGDAAHRLLLTPHIAGVTLQSWAFIFRSAWANVQRVIAGQGPLNRVF